MDSIIVTAIGQKIGISGLPTSLKYSLSPEGSDYLNGLDIFKDYKVNSTPPGDRLVETFVKTHFSDQANIENFKKNIHDMKIHAVYPGEYIVFSLAGDRTVSNFIPGIEHFFAECGAGYEKVLLNPYSSNVTVYQTAAQYADEGPGSGDSENLWPPKNLPLIFDEKFMELYGFNNSREFGVTRWESSGDVITMNMSFGTFSGKATEFKMSNPEKNDSINNLAQSTDKLTQEDGIKIIRKALGDAMQNATYLAFCLYQVNFNQNTDLSKCLMSTCDYTVHLRNILAGLPSNYYGKKIQRDGEGDDPETDIDNNQRREQNKCVGTLFFPATLTPLQKYLKLFEAEILQIISSNESQAKLLRDAMYSIKPFVFYGLNRPSSKRKIHINVKKNIDFWEGINQYIQSLNAYLLDYLDIQKAQLIKDNNAQLDNIFNNCMNHLRYFRLPFFVVLGKHGTGQSTLDGNEQYMLRYEFKNQYIRKNYDNIISNLVDEEHVTLKQCYDYLANDPRDLSQYGGGAKAASIPSSLEATTQEDYHALGGAISEMMTETVESIIYSFYIDVIYELQIDKDFSVPKRYADSGYNFDNLIKGTVEKVMTKYGLKPTTFKVDLDHAEFQVILNEEMGVIYSDTTPLYGSLNSAEYNRILNHILVPGNDGLKIIQYIASYIDYESVSSTHTDFMVNDAAGYGVGDQPRYPSVHQPSYTGTDFSNSQKGLVFEYDPQFQSNDEGGVAGMDGVTFGGSSKLSKKKKRKTKVKRGKKSIKKQKSNRKSSNKKKVKRVAKRKYSHKKRNKKK